MLLRLLSLSHFSRLHTDFENKIGTKHAEQDDRISRNALDGVSVGSRRRIDLVYPKRQNFEENDWDEVGMVAVCV